MQYPVLSFCIPTLNRENILERVLENLFSISCGLPVEVCVSNNASDDGTAVVVKKYDGRQNFRVIHQPERLGYGLNVMAAVEQASANYVWALPDYAHVERSALVKILELLGSDVQQDLIIVNVSKRIRGRSEGLICSAAEGVLKYGWHTTLLGSCVVQKKAYLSLDGFLKASNFIQVFAAFVPIASKNDFRGFFLGQNAWFKDSEKKTAWSRQALSVWMREWSYACHILQKYFSENICSSLIRSHHSKSNVFSFLSLLRYRVSDGCSLSEIFSLRDFWLETGVWYVIKAVMVAVLPVVVVKLCFFCFIDRALVAFLRFNRMR